MPLIVKDKDGNAVTTGVPSGSVYSYSGLAFTPVATPTAVIVVKASASKTVYLHRVRLAGIATSAGNMAAIVTKRSDDGTPGSAALTGITPCKDTTGAAAATATVSTVGTANYTTLGTSAGQITAGRVQMTASGSGVAAVPFLWDAKKPIALAAGSTEEFTVELGGVAVPSGGKVDWEVVTEEV